MSKCHIIGNLMSRLKNFIFMFRQSCKVLAVIPPEGAVVNGDASDENGEEGEKKKRYFYNRVKFGQGCGNSKI